MTAEVMLIWLKNLRTMNKKIEIYHSKPLITKNNISDVSNILNSGMIAQGNITSEFETAFGNWFGIKNKAIATGSGTEAIILALKAIRIKQNDEIILPSYVCTSLLQAVVALGAKPILSDMNNKWQLTPEHVKSLITNNTKAIIIPHLYGIFTNIKPFKSLEIPIIEDFAQAIGKKESEITGDIAVFSFHPTKCLTTGEGGILISNNENIIDSAKKIMANNNYTTPIQISRLSNMAASLGLSQLRDYPSFLNKRQKIADKYIKSFNFLFNNEINYLRTVNTMFFRFPLIVKGGIDRYEKLFATKGIHVRKGVDKLLHRELGLKDYNFPNSVFLFSNTISLPIYPALTDIDVDYIIEETIKIFSKN